MCPKVLAEFENDNFQIKLSFFAYWYQIDEQTICVLNVMLLWIFEIHQDDVNMSLLGKIFEKRSMPNKFEPFMVK